MVEYADPDLEELSAGQKILVRVGLDNELRLKAKLREAEGACQALERPDLAACVEEAAAALHQVDLKTYRRKIETVVSRLGHLR